MGSVLRESRLSTMKRQTASKTLSRRSRRSAMDPGDWDGVAVAVALILTLAFAVALVWALSLAYS